MPGCNYPDVSIKADPLVTVVVPTLNQGRYLDHALGSIFSQGIPVEIFVLDGGSTDETQTIIDRWQHRLAGWRSAPDAGQAAAINEGISLGRAPYVCWLNSDDWYLPNGLALLMKSLIAYPSTAMVYGRTSNFFEATQQMSPVFVLPFNEWIMARVCIISQPGTLMRRSAWEVLGGVNPNLHMAMDYDLWWRCYRRFGKPRFIREFVAVNREHGQTKTNSQRYLHYDEAMAVVRSHYGRVPLKWWLARPYAVWFRSRFPRA